MISKCPLSVSIMTIACEVKNACCSSRYPGLVTLPAGTLLAHEIRKHCRLYRRGRKDKGRRARQLDVHSRNRVGFGHCSATTVIPQS